METRLVEVEIKRQRVSISFNILPLSKDKAVLGILFLKEFNLNVTERVRVTIIYSKVDIIKLYI